MYSYLPQTVFPTKNGGHTYVGFIVDEDDKTVRPDTTNFELLSDEDRKLIADEFASVGLRLS